MFTFFLLIIGGIAIGGLISKVAKEGEASNTYQHQYHRPDHSGTDFQQQLFLRGSRERL